MPILMQPICSTSQPQVGLLVASMLLMFVAGSVCAQQVRPAKVTIGGVIYTGAPQPQVQDGLIWGPVIPLARMLSTQINWDPQTGRCELVSAEGRRLILQVGEALVQIGDTGFPLEAPAVVAAGELIAPLPRLLQALGARVKAWPEQGILVADAILRRIELYGGDEGLAVRLVTTGPVNGEVRYLKDPERAFIDLPGLAVDQKVGDKYIGRDGVWRLRWSQFQEDPNLARFVLDLKAPQQVRWVPAPDGGRLEVGTLTGDEPIVVAERPRLEMVHLQSEPAQSSLLTLQFSGPVDFTWEANPNPWRITLKLPDALSPEIFQPADKPGAPIREVQVIPSPPGHGLTIKVFLGWLMHVGLQTNPLTSRIEISLRRESLTGKRLIIDPGHGGEDSGARAYGLQEKDLNLEVSLDLVSRLKAAGALAFLTRDQDVFIPLAERPRLATALQADAFVSVHCNAMPQANTNHGTESYYYTPPSQVLAYMLQQALVAGLGRRDNGVRRRKFAVLWRSPQPCALVELMYMDNEEEAALLKQSAVRQRAAEALFEGLRAYFEGVPLVEESLAGAEKEQLGLRP